MIKASSSLTGFLFACSIFLTTVTANATSVATTSTINSLEEVSNLQLPKGDLKPPKVTRSSFSGNAIGNSRRSNIKLFTYVACTAVIVVACVVTVNAQAKTQSTINDIAERQSKEKLDDEKQLLERQLEAKVVSGLLSLHRDFLLEAASSYPSGIRPNVEVNDYTCVKADKNDDTVATIELSLCELPYGCFCKLSEDLAKLMKKEIDSAEKGDSRLKALMTFMDALPTETSTALTLVLQEPSGRVISYLLIKLAESGALSEEMSKLCSSLEFYKRAQYISKHDNGTGLWNKPYVAYNSDSIRAKILNETSGETLRHFISILSKLTLNSESLARFNKAVKLEGYAVSLLNKQINGNKSVVFKNYEGKPIIDKHLTEQGK